MTQSYKSFILKSLVPLAETEKFSKDAMLLQTNISHTTEFLVHLMFFTSMCRDFHMFRDTNFKVMFGF